MAEPLSVLITTLVTWAIASVVVHFAAKVVMGGSRLIQAFIAVLVGSVLAALVDLGTSALDWPGWVNVFLALAAFALGLAIIYRESWLRGALLGVVAWLLWVFIRYLIGLFF